MNNWQVLKPSPLTSNDRNRMTDHRRIACVLLSAALLFSTGCFEEPVRNTVIIEPLNGGEARVTTIVEMNDVSSNRFARERLDAARSQILQGTDAWSHRYNGIEATSELFRWEKEEGVLKRMERSAVVDAKNLALLFSDSSFSIFLESGDGYGELSIYPAASNRATPAQNRTLQASMTSWTRTLSRYLTEVGHLYRYLEVRPDRARPVFAAVFEDLLPREELEEVDELTDEENELVERVSHAMAAASTALAVPDDDAWSLDEISRIDYDPFPADFRVVVPGPIVAAEGFTEDDEGRLEVRQVGLWKAMESLIGNWVSPDPLVAWMETARGEKRFDLDAFVSLPRRFQDAPAPDDLLAAIEAQLRPEPVYRVTWRE